MTDQPPPASPDHGGVESVPDVKPGDTVHYTFREGPFDVSGVGVVRSVMLGLAKIRANSDRRLVTCAIARLRLIDPKDVQVVVREGDRVRVVLEGEVSTVFSDGFLIGNNRDGNIIGPDLPWVTSVEVIDPPKPSCADLPVGSVVRDSHGVLHELKREDTHYPWQSLGGYWESSNRLDDVGWTLYLPDAGPAVQVAP